MTLAQIQSRWSMICNALLLIITSKMKLCINVCVKYEEIDIEDNNQVYKQIKYVMSNFQCGTSFEIDIKYDILCKGLSSP